MKYLILFLAIISFSSIFSGFLLDLECSQKLIGFGVSGLFLIVFPLFTYHHWKNKDLKDYMLTKENLDKMRETENQKKH